VRLPWRTTPEDREQRRIDRMLALGHRGTITLPEGGLPDGFEPPSAALAAPRPVTRRDDRGTVSIDNGTSIEFAALKAPTYAITIDDAYRERVREWLESYAMDAMLRNVTPSLPAWLPLRETGIRFYVPPATSGGLDLYECVTPAARNAYVVLFDGSEVTVPVPPGPL
jgi:hypothetical protein